MKKAVLFFSLFLITGLFAQNVNFNLTGAGARAAGMGGAFIGVADDATAIVWNPSGLTLLERPEASIVGRLVADSYKWEFNDIDEEYEESQSHPILNFLSGAYPFRIGSRKIVVALALQQQIDLYSYDKEEYFGETYESEGIGGVNTATLGGGIQILPFLYGGFAQNLWYGKYEYTSDFGDDNYEESYSGMNFVFGLMLDMNGLMNPVPFKLGVTFRSPFTLNIDYKDEFDYEEEYELDMPTMIGFGASYRFGEFFTVAADYETRKFEAADFPYDMNQFRLGAEYLLVADFAVIPLRAGVFNHPTFWSDENGDQIMGAGVAFGSGLIFERFALDMSLSGNVTEIDFGQETFTITQAIIALSGIIYFN